MKRCWAGISIIIILLCIPLTLADSWETYGKNLTANGVNSESVGYLNRSVAFFNISFGMSYQPLVSDLDGDGFNELVLWQNDTLRIYNKSIVQLVEYKLGILQSQPSISNFTGNKKSIIALQGTNFTAINFNGSIAIAKNFNLNLNVNNSGLICGLIDNDSLEDCVFKDNNGYLHMFDNNANSLNEDKLNVYVGNNSDIDVNFSIASIADFDNDGRNEILVKHSRLIKVVDSVTGNVDLTYDMAQDTNYGGWGLHPINPFFFDANKDGYYEIFLTYPKRFTIFYVNNFDYGFGYKVINRTGGVMWTNECAFDFTSSSITITTASKPVPLDTTDSEHTEIVLVCSYSGIGSEFGYGLYLGINVIDGFNGTIYKTSNVTFEMSFSTENDFTAIADINNNGIYDMLLTNGAYEVPRVSNTINRTFDYNNLSFAFRNPIAVDIDGNGALDIIQSSNQTTYVFLDNTNYYNDLGISSNDVSYYRVNGSNINVSVNIHNLGSVNAFNINVTVANQNTNEEDSRFVNLTESITTVSFVMGNFTDGDKIIAFVDASNVFNETDENNNFAETLFKGTSMYLDIRLPYGLNRTFEDYIKSKFNDYNFVTNEENADIVLSVGKQTGIIVKYTDFVLNIHNFGILDGIIVFEDKHGNEPYIGLIAGFENNSRKHLFVLGNEIEGEIAAAVVLNEEVIDNMIPTYLDRFNEEGIATYEYLHNSDNNQYYATDSNEFRQIVKIALNGRFTVENYTVYTNDNVSLRLMKVKPLNSKAFSNFTNRTKPIVLSKGLWSSINDWKDFASELANDGSEAWIIEITGGPGTECDTCADYTFDNLTDSYFPALIAGVQFYTNSSKIDYVGFSNGCRTALSSLDKWNNVGRTNIGKVYIDNNWINVNMTAYPIETFVGVACPGAFNSSDPYGTGVVYGSEVGNALNTFGQRVINNLRSQNVTHASLRLIARSIRSLTLGFTNIGNKISSNLFESYYNFSSTTIDTQPGKGLSLSQFGIIEGDIAYTSDIVVFVSDEKQIYDNVNATTKTYLRIFESHFSIDDEKRTKSFVKRILYNQSFSTFEELFNVKERS